MGVGQCRARIPCPTVTVANGGQHLRGPVAGAGIVLCSVCLAGPVPRQETPGPTDSVTPGTDIRA